MEAKQVMEHFREVGTWVNWEETCDQFLHGNPNVEVKGIAMAWIATAYLRMILMLLIGEKADGDLFLRGNFFLLVGFHNAASVQY